MRNPALKADERVIRTAGRSLSIQDNRLLAVKYNEKNRIYYALPREAAKKKVCLYKYV